MRTHAAGKICVLALVGVALAAALPTSAFAQPVVKTVPWVATNPLIPHDTWSGKSIRLKGTSDVQGAAITYTWDFGDGSPVASGTVSNMYVIEAAHTYTGVVGTVFVATLTVTNTTAPPPNSASKQYYVVIRDKALDVEVNVAIDEGLWYMHKTMTRDTCTGGLPCGHWTSSGYAGSGNHSNDAVNVNAFLVNGHKEAGDAGNPYVETVERGTRRLFTRLASTTIGNQTNPLGTFNPDHNGNGIALYMTQGQEFYQTGPVISAIVATGTPAKLTDVGAANVIGRKYADIVQDLVDRMAYCQSDTGATAGGWRYSCQDAPDNSAAQWAAIGLLAARGWGTGVPGVTPVTFNSLVTQVNYQYWLTYSQNADGRFGYTTPAYWAWGWYATTPSGMVQSALDGYGRGSTLWDRAEAYMRSTFCNSGSATQSVRDYYYGLFALVKAMLVHDSNGDAVPEPLETLGLANPIDWYRAQALAGDPCDGVARTLVNDQNAAGYWSGHNYRSDQYDFETAWAILMLSRTLFEAGAPVAVATVTPASAVVGQTVTFSGASSFHQDSSKTIDSWAWEICKTAGAPIASCPTLENKTGVVVTSSFGALGLYQARLTVTDNGVPERSASTIVTVNVAIPPLAPTADAGGPYGFCPGATPWFLDGTGSVNPDDGQSEPGAPGDFIKEYAWDLDGDNAFDDAFGAQPDVTAFFGGKPVGSYLIQLRVTDNTKLSFPSSGMGDLSDTDVAQVYVRAATDPLCTCNTLTARAKPTKADLVWTVFPGAASYHVYRGTIGGGPYLYIANATGTVYADFGLVNGTTYYWVVRPALANTSELCQSNQASATPRAR